GQLIIIVILNIGGIGVMVIGTMLWVELGTHIGFRERKLLMKDNNKNTMRGTVNLIIDIVKTIFGIELEGAMLLAYYFYRVFVSISATTNGGLDITGKSLIPYAH
ncbi:ATP synthase, partial [Staphylococcus aureus]